VLWNVSLTGAPTEIVLAVIALGLPIVVALLWRRLPTRMVGGLLRVLMIIGCQAIAIVAVAVAVAVNRSFEFYDSWDDVLGRQQPGQAVVSDDGPLVAADGSQGAIKIITVHGKVSGSPSGCWSGCHRSTGSRRTPRPGSRC
jgi:hypothetical protein